MRPTLCEEGCSEIVLNSLQLGGFAEILFVPFLQVGLQMNRNLLGDWHMQLARL